MAAIFRGSGKERHGSTWLDPHRNQSESYKSSIKSKERKRRRRWTEINERVKPPPAYAPLSKREGDSSKHVAADAATHDVQHQQPYGYRVQGNGSSPDAHMRDDDSETDMEMEFLLANSISVMFVR
ncbi:hypothetical protein YC2023_063237 [Brassica napus]